MYCMPLDWRVLTVLGSRLEAREPARRTGRTRAPNQIRAYSTRRRSGKQHHDTTLRPRELAVQQLLRIEEEGAYIGLLERFDQQEAHNTQAPDSHRRTVTEMVANVTRFRRLLDWRLDQLTKRPLSSTHPALLQLLRLGVYEIFEADLPQYACSDYVDLAGALVGEWSKKFVNATLRAATRIKSSGGQLLPQRPPPKAPRATLADALGTIHSHPTWMVDRWLQRFGAPAAEQLMAANNRPPPHGVRANSLKGVSAASLLWQIDGPQVDAAYSRFLPDEFLHIRQGLQSVVQSGLLQDGSCMVQDASAGLVVALLDPQPGEAILDACAAPGGKTLFIAARMHNEGSLLALDSSIGRLQALSRAADSAGIGPMLSIGATTLQNYVSSLEPGILASQQETSVQQQDQAPDRASPQSSGAANSGDSSQPQVNSAESWNGFDGYHEELDEFYGTDNSIAGLLGSWQEPETAASVNVQDEGVRSDSDTDEYQQDDGGNGDSSAPSPESLPGTSSPEAPPGLFDRVLLDVPCSGQGVLAKRADRRWRHTQQQLSDLVSLQAELLEAAAVVVKPGGLLVYSTCSIESEENEQQVFAFVAAHPEFSIEAAPGGLLPTEVVTADHFVSTLPHVHDTDGAFAARLRRKPSGSQHPVRQRISGGSQL